MHENIKKKQGRWESFDNIDRLGNYATCLLEDKNGYIWVGTQSGLCRYDGKEFVNFTTNEGLVSNVVFCIYQDREGDLWIGTSEGLSQYDGKRFVNFSTKDGLPGNYVRCVYQDRAGDLWVGTADGGLSKYDGKRFVNFTTKDGLPGNDIRCIHQDKAGDLWVGVVDEKVGATGARKSGLVRYDGQSHRFVTLIENSISRILEDREGNLWIAHGSGLHQYNYNRRELIKLHHKYDSKYINYLYQDKEGNLWLSFWGDGVKCYDAAYVYSDRGEIVTFTAEDGLANDFVFDIIQDREGNFWFACGHGGISRYNPYEISYISDEAVNEAMIKDRDGNLWWGFGYILSQFDGKNVNRYPFEPELDGYLVDDKISALFEDSQGQLWVGTMAGGIFIYDDIKNIKNTKPGGQKPKNFTTKDGLVDNAILTIFEDSHGNIWIGTRHGLSRCDYAGKKFANFTTEDGLGSNFVAVIYQDKDGNIWFGGWGDGVITKYDAKGFHRYPEDKVLSNSAKCIIEDDKNNLWIGTSMGIICYDEKSPKSRNYTTKDGLLGGLVQGIMRDSRGNIWISTLGGGISRFDGKNFQALTTDDGLPSNSVTGIIEDRKQETENRKQETGNRNKSAIRNPKSKIQNRMMEA